MITIPIEGVTNGERRDQVLAQLKNLTKAEIIEARSTLFDVRSMLLDVIIERDQIIEEVTDDRPV